MIEQPGLFKLIGRGTFSGAASGVLAGGTVTFLFLGCNMPNGFSLGAFFGLFAGIIAGSLIGLADSTLSLGWTADPPGKWAAVALGVALGSVVGSIVLVLLTRYVAFVFFGVPFGGAAGGLAAPLFRGIYSWANPIKVRAQGS